MAKTELAAFDDSDLDGETKGKLIVFAGEANRAIKKYSAGMVELGEACHNANELLAGKGREGKFKPWVEIILGISKSSAYDAMNVYERAQEFPCIATYPHTVAVLLSKPDVPDSAIKAFQKQVDKGHKPTIAGAKQAVDGKKCPEFRTLVAEPVAETVVAETETANSEEQPESESTDNTAVQPNPDLGKCPVCAGTKWKETEKGIVCAKCGHAHGEAVGDVDDQRVSDQRSKTVKTVEALMRAFDDLNLMLPKPQHGAAIERCKSLLTWARDWK